MTRATHGRTWWDNLREHMPAAPAASPVLTAGEQTRLSWARRIETPEAAPPIYAPNLAAITARAGCFPYCVLTPAYAGFLTRTTEKLLCAYADEIAIVERAGGELRSTVYPLGSIDLMEMGCILLSSWFKIVGTDDRGRRAVTTIKFNTVTDYLLTPLLDRWRSVQGGRGAASLAQEQAKFDYLCREHYKFMNIARRVILPGDCVLASIMQPELRTPVAELFGHVYSRSRAPAHIVVLTDRELIVAAEEKPSLRRDTSRYGSVATYIPRRKIEGIALNEAGNGCVTLAVRLPEGEQVQIEFAAAQSEDVTRLAALLECPVEA